MKKQFGLIGYPLSHSFSKKYFAEKFGKEGIQNCKYDLFEIEDIKFVEDIFEKPGLQGFNVTIPYKHDIMQYMNSLDHSAQKVGAVNVVKINSDAEKIGFNSDYYGFRKSLEDWIPDLKVKAIVLGIGGAAKAVIAALADLSIPFLRISRDSSKGDMTYQQLQSKSEIMVEHKLIINTTPLGMSPHIDAKPELDYEKISKQHYLYDLIYNPAQTKFLSEGKLREAQTKNGLEMLELQAEKSWEIWNQ